MAGESECGPDVVGKDWQTRDYFVEHEGWDQGISTDFTLLEFLESIGIEIGRRVAGSSPDRIFVTNSVLCLKQTTTSGSLRRGWVKNCSYFLRRQVLIVAPKVVVALGADALAGMQYAFPHVSKRSLTQAVEDPEGEELVRGTRMFAVFHCSGLGLAQRPKWQQRQDWQRIGKALAAGRSEDTGA